MKRTLTIAMTLAAVAALSATAMARPWGEGGGRGKGGGFGPGAKMAGHGMMMLGRCVMESADMDLTPDQKEAIRQIRDGAKDEMKAHFSEMKELKDSFLKAFADPGVTDDQLKDLSNAIHEHMAGLKDRRLGDFLKVRGILTPEQLTKIPGIVKDCRPGHRGRFRGGRR